MKYDFLKLLQTPGETVTEDVLKRAIAIEAIYTKSDLLTTGLSFIGLKPFRDQLEAKYGLPSDVDAEYPVATGRGPRTWKITWSDFELALAQAETGFFVDDTAILREGSAGLQWRTGISRCAEALAKVRSKNIVQTLHAGQGLTAAAAATWDAAATTADSIIGDIQKAMGAILDGARIQEIELKNCALIAPPKAYMALTKITTFDNTKMPIAAVLKQAHNLECAASRDIPGADDALVLVKGEQTALHGVLVTNRIPLIEDERIRGRGREYTIRQFFATKIFPLTSGATTTKRIFKITNVVT